MIDIPKLSFVPEAPPRRAGREERRMIDIAKLRRLKGRRIYLFWLDEETGDISDVTSRDDVVQVIRCKDCKHFLEWGNVTGACRRSKNSWNWLGVDSTDFCSFAERREE